MDTYEDDDDTHFCIKCHLTVNGLDNYVRHRQSGCRGPEVKQSEVANEPPSTPTTVTYPEILNADAFFSSLELQSSAKSNVASRPRGMIESEKKVGRVEEKGKKKVRRGQQEPDDVALKEKLLNMPPVVADLDDLMDHLGIPSLVGFPDIVTTTGAKTTAITTAKSVGTSSSAKSNQRDNSSASPVESIIASSKGSSERKRSEDPPRMEQDHAGWLDDTILVDLDTNTENKDPDHGELTGYGDYDYRQVDESDEDTPDDDIEDNDSYSNDEETQDREYPPPGHTGGKWKPGEILHDIDRLNEEEFGDDEDNQDNPPSLHTGGKWKPGDNSQGQRIDENELAGKEAGVSSSETPVTTERRQPPPGHTRGKWIPGAHGDLGSGYWCDPCGRKLASRLLYNRHLLSDLHARRSIQEIDGDLQLPRGIVGSLGRRKPPTSKRQRALAEIKSRSKAPSLEEDRVARKKTRRRRKEVLVCEMCQARVRRPQMGKHLLSHYHCRVAGTNPCGDPAARRFILENMSNVVRQCPFQCAICRFYCNTEATFLRHWRSTYHTSKLDDIEGIYKCRPCDFHCEKNETMDHHLTSSGHREVVAMMNGSVPVVIARQRFLICDTCHQRFRYNIQLRLHARETGHGGNATATDEYQSRITCPICSQVHRSLVSLQRHQLSCHASEKRSKDVEAETVVQPSAPYFCSFCVLNFTTAREAVLHRRTSSHKEIVKAQKLNAESLSSLAKDCPHCGSRQPSLSEHKEHLLHQHPELCHRCPRCGLLFALPQDVTRHTRDVDCTKPSTEYPDKTKTRETEWSCNDCPFTTDSQAEFLFHDALHAGSIDQDTEQPGSSKTPSKYRCPMCRKLFCKVTLRNHIRSHTGERPFRCVKCSETFSRRSSLNLHRKECSSLMTWRGRTEVSRRRNHTCSECNTAFYTNETKNQDAWFDEELEQRSKTCNDQCQISIFNLSDTIVNCRQRTSPNSSKDFVFDDGKEGIESDAGNKTVVCFINADSGCNSLKNQVTAFHGAVSKVHAAVGIGLFFAAIALPGLLIVVIYWKRRNAKLAYAASFSNRIMIEWADDSDPNRNAVAESTTLHALKQHTMRHAGKNYKCGLPGCPTILRTENELRLHRSLVHETGSSSRQFRCNECPYASKTKTQLRRHQRRHDTSTADENSTQMSCPYSHCNFTTKLTSHLKRHVRLHTGTKPYKCRHCAYASNNLENLRKHVISTSLHPGKTIYECDVCEARNNPVPYSTNFAKELRAHLLEAHPRDFPRPSDASDHVAKIFKPDGESPESSTPLTNESYEDSITNQIQDQEL